VIYACSILSTVLDVDIYSLGALERLKGLEIQSSSTFVFDEMQVED
jgi:hypothetical protein